MKTKKINWGMDVAILLGFVLVCMLLAFFLEGATLLTTEAIVLYKIDTNGWAGATGVFTLGMVCVSACVYLAWRSIPMIEKFAIKIVHRVWS